MMTWSIFGSSLILSMLTLVPLGIKWEIEKKITFPAAFFIGILTGLITNMVIKLWDIQFLSAFVLEFFLIVTIAGSLLLWRFYRDPDRIPPKLENTILSPADGKIIYVKKIGNGEVPFSEKKGTKLSLNNFIRFNFLAPKGYLVGISMNFLDVHVNRAPIEGKITLLKRLEGKFLSLKRKEALIKNERVLTVIDNGHLKIGIVQIASRLVRRIISYFSEGQTLEKGQRFGKIRFGSQVDLIIPSLVPIRIQVKPGEKVKAGISIIAFLSE
jgi:phosphatidylserine decarboxylase